MKLIARWAEYAALTLEEASFILAKIDPLYHEECLEFDSQYEDIFYEQDYIHREISEKLNILKRAVLAQEINLAAEWMLTNSADLPQNSLITKNAFIEWCKTHHYTEVVEAFANAELAAAKKANKNPLASVIIAEPVHDVTSPPMAPSPDVKKHKKLRGCQASIVEHWAEIKAKYGVEADGHQVLRILKEKTDRTEKPPVLKTVQNCLCQLKKAGIVSR